MYKKSPMREKKNIYPNTLLIPKNSLINKQIS